MGETLERAGVGWDDVAHITSYPTDRTTQMPGDRRREESLRERAPAWTASGLNRLIPERGITKIKLVAKLPKR